MYIARTREAATIVDGLTTPLHVVNQSQLFKSLQNRILFRSDSHLHVPDCLFQPGIVAQPDRRHWAANKGSSCFGLILKT